VPKVDAVGARRERDVNAVIHDNARARPAGQVKDLSRQIHQRRGFKVALPHLHEVDTGVCGLLHLVE
jgi:hypothetical protein